MSITTTTDNLPNIEEEQKEEQKQECCICLEEKKQLGSCSYCNAMCCSKCLQTYILSVKQQPQCYSCKQPLSHHFLMVNTTKIFRTKLLRDHLKEIIWDQEKSLLPSSQERATRKLSRIHYETFEYLKYHLNQIVEQQDELKNVRRKQLSALLKGWEEIQKYRKNLTPEELSSNICYKLEIAKVLTLKGYVDTKNQVIENFNVMNIIPTTLDHNVTLDLKTYEEELETLKKKTKFSDSNDRISNDEHDYEKPLWQYMFGPNVPMPESPTLRRFNVQQTDAESANVKRKPQFLRPCPSSDCRGYCNEEGICPLCSNSICIICWVSLPPGQPTEEHKCQKSDIDSKMLIQKETCPCPKCHTPIQKSTGCDHMFCVLCYTGFNYRTGREVSNAENTNPMLRDWMRRHAPNTEQLPQDFCGRVNVRNQWDRTLKYILNTNFIIPEYSSFLKSLDHIIAILYMKQRNLTQPPVHRAGDNEDLRVKYLIKQIDEKQFKVQALKVIRKRQSEEDLLQLYIMFTEASTRSLEDYLNALKQRRDDVSTKEHINEKFLQYEAGVKSLVAYYNECLDSLAQTHFASTKNAYFTSNQITIQDDNTFYLRGH